MPASRAIPIARHVLWMSGAVLVCLAVAALGSLLIRIVRVVLAGEPVAAALTLEAPITITDLWIMLAIFAVIAADAVHTGWHRSGLRRLLQGNDATTRTDLVYFVMSITGAITVVTVATTLGICSALEALTDRGIGIRLGANLPLYVAIPGVLIIQSFAVYWLHRMMHTPLFWPLHAVHHAATDFNVAVVFRHHPIDGFFGSLSMPLIPALLGFSSEAILITYTGLAAYTAYVHSALPSPQFLERWVCFGPHGHGIHHGSTPECIDTNFADFVIWDRMFGTYKVDVAEPLTYGCTDPDGVYQSGRPLRDMVTVQAVWLAGLGRAIAGLGGSIACRAWYGVANADQAAR